MHTPTSQPKCTHYAGDLMTTTPTAQSRIRSCFPNIGANAGGASGGCITPKSTLSHTTPSPMCNPFESEYEHLQHMVVTPGIFRKTEETPDSKSKPFQWDIEQIAVLNPIDFGDVTEKLKKQDKHCRKVDKLAHVQGAIDKFFENELIVPSPWSEPVQKVNLLAKIEEERSMVSDSKRNASSQTDIHIPLSLDFNELFKDFKLSDSRVDEYNRGESMNSSSLRRRLFGNDSDSNSNSGHNTPEKQIIPSDDCWKSPPLGEWCASSPVFGQASSDHFSRRRCSFTMSRLETNGAESSPNLSPISSPDKLHPVVISRGLVKSSPDIRESIQKLRGGLSFNLQDEFHLSNSGLITDSESEVDLPDKLCPRADVMSVDLHLSMVHQDYDSQITENGDHNMLSDYHFKEDDDEARDANSSVSSSSDSCVGMSSVIEDGQTAIDRFPQITLTYSASDTGYQTASLNTLQMSDTCVLPDYAKTHNSVSLAVSPRKDCQAREPSWDPAVASTPNKVRLNINNMDEEFISRADIG